MTLMGFASLYPSYVLAVYTDPLPSHIRRMDSRQHAHLGYVETGKAVGSRDCNWLQRSASPCATATRYWRRAVLPVNMASVDSSSPRAREFISLWLRLQLWPNLRSFSSFQRRSCVPPPSPANSFQFEGRHAWPPRGIALRFPSAPRSL